MKIMIACHTWTNFNWQCPKFLRYYPVILFLPSWSISVASQAVTVATNPGLQGNPRLPRMTHQRRPGSYLSILFRQIQNFEANGYVRYQGPPKIRSQLSIQGFVPFIFWKKISSWRVRMKTCWRKSNWSQKLWFVHDLRRTLSHQFSPIYLPTYLKRSQSKGPKIQVLPLGLKKNSGKFFSPIYSIEILLHFLA